MNWLRSYHFRRLVAENAPAFHPTWVQLRGWWREALDCSQLEAHARHLEAERSRPISRADCDDWAADQARIEAEDEASWDAHVAANPELYDLDEGEPAPAAAQLEPAGSQVWTARDRLGSATSVKTFRDRAKAVSFARRRSTPAFPCDVFAGDGSLVFRPEMDVQPIQGGLFS